MEKLCMVEIYLFINPLEKYCLRAEKEILEFVAEEPKKIAFRFIPFLNLSTVNRFLEQNHWPTDDIHLRNSLFKQMYQAALDYKALQLQGKKKGRAYLLAIQEAVSLERQTVYNEALVRKVIQSLDADTTMFYEDRKSTLVKESFLEDQQIASEMGIKRHPSVVVFNYDCNRDFGVLLEDYSSKEMLHALCRTDEESCQIFYKDTHLKRPELRHRTLHLL